MRQRIDLNTPETLEIFDDGNRAKVKARILRTGKFTSGINGHTFEITIQHLIKVKNNYNGKLKEYVKSLFNATLPEYELQEVQMAPTCVEHKIDDEFVVGRIVGKLTLEDDSITKTTWLCAMLEVLGRENVEKVKDGRRKAVSINFNTETCELDEISFVAQGAIPDACVMSASKMMESPIYTENLEINAVLKRINELETSIDNRYLSIAKLRKETTFLDNKISFTNKLQSLVKKCQLTKTDMKRIINTIDNDVSEDTLKTVTAVLSKLPKCVDTRRNKYNLDDFDLREYLMNSKKELTTDEVLAKLHQSTIAKLKGDRYHDKYIVEASGHDNIERKMEKEINHAHGEEHQIMLKHEHIEHLKHLIKSGKHDEAHTYLCALSDNNIPESEEEVEELVSHEAKEMENHKSKKHVEMKKHEDELEKEKKEKAELKSQLDQTNAQLSALTGALNKVLNKGE